MSDERLKAIRSHYETLPAHVKDRATGRMLFELLVEVTRLRNVERILREQLSYPKRLESIRK